MRERERERERERVIVHLEYSKLQDWSYEINPIRCGFELGTAGYAVQP